MLVEALLCGLVVIGCHRKNSLDAEPGDLLDERRNPVRSVASHAGKDRHLAPCLFDHDTDHAEIFFVLERGRLAGGAAGDKEINPLAELELDEPAQRLDVDRAGLRERRHQSRATTFDVQAHHAPPCRDQAPYFNDSTTSEKLNKPRFPTTQRAA